MTVQLIVHIDEQLNPAAVGRAQARLRSEKGVVRAELSGEKTHLMMVGYDPGATRAGEIVATLRGLGLHVQAVGL